MNEQNHKSVSDWMRGLNDGDVGAAQQLWDRYFEKLIRQAEVRIRDCPRGVLNAEDIAASVFESLWRGAQEGRFQNVKNRDELWWLLLSLTRQKSANHVRKESAQKRGGNFKQISNYSDENQKQIFEQLVSDEPTAEYSMLLEEEYSRLLSLLRDDVLRRIAVLRLEGYTNQEISTQLKISVPTVTRKFKLIRDTWTSQMEE